MKGKEENTITGICYAQKIAHNRYLPQFFLNIHQLERQGADIQSKVQELEDLNKSLRERDKVKDDAIAQLSDQLLTICKATRA